MSYKHATEHQDHTDLASGRVLYSQPGTTAFPVRLASELFQRCRHQLEVQGRPGPYAVYDPCCGGAYLLTAIGFLHGDSISRIFASDVDSGVLALACRNLSLLDPSGMEHRIAQLQKLLAEYGKDSHREALASGARLMNALTGQGPIPSECVVADITAGPPPGIPPVDIVLTDIPYGELAHWASRDSANAIPSMLANLLGCIVPGGVVGVVSPKGAAVNHGAYERLVRFGLGKRQVVLLRARF